MAGQFVYSMYFFQQFMHLAYCQCYQSLHNQQE